MTEQELYMEIDKLRENVLDLEEENIELQKENKELMEDLGMAEVTLEKIRNLL